MLVNQQADVLATARQVFDDEIIGLKKVADSLSNDFVRAVELVMQCRGKVIFSGMGKSGHVGNKIAATLASTGTAAFFMHPAEALHGDLGMIDKNDLMIAISYSGESDELSSILPIVKRKNIAIIAITGNSSSSLARLSDCVLSINIDKEACPLNLAPTTSTTATLVLGDALAVALLSLKKFQPEDFALSHPGGSLGRKLLTKVSDIMHTGARLPKVSPQAMLKEIVVEISNKGLGLVAVVDDAQKVLGVITDGDLRRILDSEYDIRSLQATSFMTKNPKCVNSDSMAIDAVELMNKHQIGGLLAVDNEHTLVGAFNLHDLFKAKLI